MSQGVLTVVGIREDDEEEILSVEVAENCQWRRAAQRRVQAEDSEGWHLPGLRGVCAWLPDAPSGSGRNGPLANAIRTRDTGKPRQWHHDPAPGEELLTAVSVPIGGKALLQQMLGSID